MNNAPRRVPRSVLLLLAAFVVFYSRDDYPRLLEPLNAPVVYWKDCIQPYLMGRALANGVNPYAPLPELADRWIPSSNPANHPTPYPPFVALLGWPLSFMTYEDAALVWFMGELLCLELTLALCFRFWGAKWTPFKDVLCLALLLLWKPVVEELRQGQFMLGLLLLVLGSWLALRERRESLGGALLGLSIATKLMGWPILVFLIVRKRWRSVRAAFGVILTAHVVSAVALGPSVIFDYYTRVGGLNAALWRGAEGNFSAWAWGLRLFQGVGFAMDVRPLFDAPPLASIATYAFPLAVLILGGALAFQARHFDTSIGILVAVSLLISPVFWYFYLLLAVIPGLTLAQRLALRGAPRIATALLLLALLLVSAKPGFYDGIALSFGDRLEGTTHVAVPFAASLITLLPLAGLFLLLGLLWHSDGDADAGEGPRTK